MGKMILIDEATVKLAIDALDRHQSIVGLTNNKQDVEAIIALRKTLTEQPAQQEPVAWPIETNNQVEALAKQCGWDNRRYMTPEDYQIWCERMRQFVQLASPQAQPAQREWVGLTADEKREIVLNNSSPLGGMLDAEAKLREKNA